MFFEIWKRTKTMSPSIFYQKFEEHKRLCVVGCLKEYECRILENRRDGEYQLLISFVKPFKAVSTVTVSRWVRIAMEQAGVTMEKCKAHSMRGQWQVSLVGMVEVWRVF